MSRRKQLNPKPLKRMYNERGSNEEEEIDTDELLEMSESGLHARKDIEKGVLFGPYKGSITMSTSSEESPCHQDSVKINGHNGGTYQLAVDDGNEAGKWMLQLQTSSEEEDVNLAVYQEDGKIWCQTTKEVAEADRFCVMYMPAVTNHNVLASQGDSDRENSCTDFTFTQVCQQSPSPTIRNSISPNQPAAAENDHLFRCSSCGIIFQCESNYQAHKKFYCRGSASESLHPPLKKRKLTCQSNSSDDGSTPSTSPGLHSNLDCNSLLRCRSCLLSFSSRSSLDEHCVTVHGYACGKTEHPQCSSSVTSPCNLDQDSQGSELSLSGPDESGQNVFKCTVCAFETESEVLFQEHSISHVSQEPQTCEKCSMVFMSRSQLMLHMLERHPSTEHTTEGTVKRISTNTVKRAVALAMGQSVDEKHLEDESENESDMRLSTCSSEESSIENRAEESKQPSKSTSNKKRNTRENDETDQSSESLVERKGQIKTEVQTQVTGDTEMVQVDDSNMCFECNIHFNSHKNFLVHKTYYCATRHHNPKAMMRNRGKGNEAHQTEGVVSSQGQPAKERDHKKGSSVSTLAPMNVTATGSKNFKYAEPHTRPTMMISAIPGTIPVPSSAMYSVVLPVPPVSVQSLQGVTSMNSPNIIPAESGAAATARASGSEQPLDLSLKSKKSTPDKETAVKVMPLPLPSLRPQITYIPVMNVPIAAHPQVIEYKCYECDISYSKEESYLAHKKYYCASHHPPKVDNKQQSDTANGSAVAYMKNFPSAAAGSYHTVSKESRSVTSSDNQHSNQGSESYASPSGSPSSGEMVPSKDSQSSIQCGIWSPKSPSVSSCPSRGSMVLTVKQECPDQTLSSPVGQKQTDVPEIQQKELNETRSIASSPEASQTVVTSNESIPQIRVKEEPDSTDENQVRMSSEQNNSPVQEIASEDENTTECVLCNIKFSRRESYIVHKTYYCSGRAVASSDTSKSNVPVRRRTRTAGNVNHTATQSTAVVLPQKAEVTDSTADSVVKIAEPAHILVCVHCQQTFLDQKQYKKHQCRLFQCPYCMYATAVLSCLHEHLKTHSEYKPYQCGLCGFKASTKEAILANHGHGCGSRTVAETTAKQTKNLPRTSSATAASARKVSAINGVDSGNVVYITHTDPTQQFVSTATDAESCIVIKTEDGHSARDSVIRVIPNEPSLETSHSPNSQTSELVTHIATSPNIKTEKLSDDEVGEQPGVTSFPATCSGTDGSVVFESRELPIGAANSPAMRFTGSPNQCNLNCTVAIHPGEKSPTNLKKVSPSNHKSKLCKLCNIQFSNLSTFVAHKKFYCASHHTDNAVK
ncbi:zinc finger protein ZFPM2-like [Ptychodera flava]|uniref:zinc finger protein ZFPM2-like n=1 Tax=Ptychodera flava TaxID=63121 RepID=UPI003969C397